MLHFSRNPTILLPADVALFNGLTPRPGEAANIGCSVVSLDTGKLLDFSDGTFKTTPTTPSSTVAAMAGFAYDYIVRLSTSGYPRGHYRALFRQVVTGEEFSIDFSVGMHVERRLGYAAGYDGTTLTLSLWVEENGEAQTDYTTLKNVTILNASGAAVDNGTLPDNSSPSNGVFGFQKTITLAASSVYIVTCKAVVPGPSGNYEFSLRFGIARP
jgi:hypothetical protein